MKSIFALAVISVFAIGILVGSTAALADNNAEKAAEHQAEANSEANKAAHEKHSADKQAAEGHTFRAARQAKRAARDQEKANKEANKAAQDANKPPLGH